MSQIAGLTKPLLNNLSSLIGLDQATEAFSKALDRAGVANKKTTLKKEPTESDLVNTQNENMMGFLYLGKKISKLEDVLTGNSLLNSINKTIDSAGKEESTGGSSQKITPALDGVISTDKLKNMGEDSESIKKGTDSIKDLSIAIGILVGTSLLISTMGIGNMITGFLGVGVVFTAVFAILKLFSNWKTSGESIPAIEGIKDLAISVGILVGVAVMASLLINDWNKFFTTVTILALSVGSILGMLFLVSKFKGETKIAIEGIKEIAVSIGLLVGLAYLMTIMINDENREQFNKAIGFLSVMVLGMVGLLMVLSFIKFDKNLSNVLKQLSFALISLSVSLLIIAYVGTMETNIWTGIGLLIGVVTTLGIAALIIKNTNLGPSMIILSASMLLAGLAIKLFAEGAILLSQIEYGKFFAGLTAFGLYIATLAVIGLNPMIGAGLILGSTYLFLAASSMRKVAESLRLVEGLDSNKIQSTLEVIKKSLGDFRFAFPAKGIYKDFLVFLQKISKLNSDPIEKISKSVTELKDNLKEMQELNMTALIKDINALNGKNLVLSASSSNVSNFSLPMNKEISSDKVDYLKKLYEEFVDMKEDFGDKIKYLFNKQNSGNDKSRSRSLDSDIDKGD